MFSIRSNASDRELRFSQLRGDSFVVELLGHSPNATIEVSGYTDPLGLLRLLEELAACDAPWSGQRSWSALDREFVLQAACSATGQVHFEVTLSGWPGAEEEWRLTAGLITDLGSLSRIARDARVFFAS